MIAKKRKETPSGYRYTVKINGEIRKLDLKPTDLIVASMSMYLDVEQHEKLRAKLMEALARSDITNQVIIIPGGMTMNVIRVDTKP